MSSSIGGPGAKDNRTRGNDGENETEHGVYGANRDALATDRQSVVAREKAEFGGMKFGSAFFGWLTATGLAVLLLGILSGIGVGVAATNGDAKNAAQDNATTTTIVSAIVLLVVVFVAYFAGGYVAGRMARFNGVRQGVAVWLWAVIVTVVLAIIGVIAGSQFDVLNRLGTIPTGSINGNATAGGIITLVLVVILALVGAILGGLTGMRYHRKVDKVGLGL
jgi:amino acid transporter